MTEKTKNTLRWIALPFVTIITWAVVTAGVAWVYGATYTGGDGYTADILGAVYGGFFLGWLVSLIPIYFVARWIAPENKKRAALIITIVFGAILAIPFIFGIIASIILPQ